MEREVRVARGGLFHSKKVDYSPETQRFLKQLIEESKMSMVQRKQIHDSIKKGDPLPLPPKIPQSRSPPNNGNFIEDIRKIYLPRRRRKDQIELSGAYDREDQLSYQSPVDYEREKRRLQELMAFGKTIKNNRSTPQNQPLSERKDESEKKRDKISWILKEIEEREQFLNEMKKLGQGKQYEGIIRQEIAAKLRILEEMDADLKNVIKKEYNEMQEVKATTSSLFHS